MSNHALDWTPADKRAVDLVRVLAMDAVQKVGNGHPGTAMSLAPAAYLLYQRVMRHDPADPNWPGRDRFVLSCGHSSLTLYIQLYLSGYGARARRPEGVPHLGRRSPLATPSTGSPPGVETTTGPLGQGLGNAVGMAMAARRERGLLDPDAAPGASPFDHFVYAIASDGDIEEGITHEASAIAAVQELGNLILIYDDNHISIEDDTVIAKSEDVGARYEAYGWHVQHVSWVTDGGYEENVQALYDAIEAAKAVTDKPSFIVLRTIIGWPAPNKQNTGAAHGSALGDAEVAATKEILGFDPAVTFPVEEEALNRAREVAARGKALHAEWDAWFAEWEKENPERSRALRPAVRPRAPRGLGGGAAGVPRRPQGHRRRGARPARSSPPSRRCCPSCGAGPPTSPSPTNTTMEGEPSFLPANRQSEMWPGNPYGRTLHFGIREHGMGAILNGITLSGLTRPYGGTFLQFSDYMRGAVRLAALMEIPVDLRLDARLDRPRRGRPDAPAGRAPLVAAEHPAPGRRPARRRE